MMKTLNEIPGKNPFKVPENYFEEVNHSIISKTAGAEPETRRIQVYSKFRPYLAVAASVAVFIFLSYAAVRIFSPEKRNISLPEISLEEFSESYLDDIDLLVLETNADPSALSEKATDLNNTEIIDYLLLENVNLNDIYERL